MNEDIKIRPLKESDKDQMYVLMKEFWIDYNRGEMMSERTKEIDEYKDYKVTIKAEFEKYLKWISYVVEQNGKLVGFICGQINERKHKILDKEGMIEEFFITKFVRGKGLGRKLFESLKSDFLQRGCNLMGIEANSDNKRAIEVYRKFGFEDYSIKLRRKI